MVVDRWWQKFHSCVNWVWQTWFERSILYDITGSSLNISLSGGCCCIWRHLFWLVFLLGLELLGGIVSLTAADSFRFTQARRKEGGGAFTPTFLRALVKPFRWINYTRTWTTEWHPRKKHIGQIWPLQANLLVSLASAGRFTWHANTRLRMKRYPVKTNLHHMWHMAGFRDALSRQAVYKVLNWVRHS